MSKEVIVLATLDTKAQEAQFLIERLHAQGTDAGTIDLSLQSGGALLNGPEKQDAMRAAAAAALDAVVDAVASGTKVVLGLGGGTGGEIALQVMRGLPITFPKVLVTTLPFDPRNALADSSIILVPTLADICGLNATLREVFENVAALTAGLCKSQRKADACLEQTSIGITALGATEGAVAPLVAALSARGDESTVFHANGYGGAAFARFARRGAFNRIIDLTSHELTRLHLAGAHVEMPDRFSAGASLPRIMLPGGLNFVGLGAKPLVPESFLKRPHYSHSGHFTHAKVTAEEMEQLAGKFAEILNAASGPSALIIPMGGFSHQDRPGGAIEDAGLRRVFHDVMLKQLEPGTRMIVLDAHIEDASVTAEILSTLDTFPSD